MSLHLAEFTAGNLIAVTLAGIAFAWALHGHRKHREPPPDSPGRGETTEFSSTQDD